MNIVIWEHDDGVWMHACICVYVCMCVLKQLEFETEIRRDTSVLSVKSTFLYWLSCLTNPSLTFQVILLLLVIWSSLLLIEKSKTKLLVLTLDFITAMQIVFVKSLNMIAGYHLAITCTFSKRYNSISYPSDFFFLLLFFFLCLCLSLLIYIYLLLCPFLSRCFIFFFFFFLCYSCCYY